MLLSMTGYGEAHNDTIRVELRAINNRHLKVVVRGTDPYPLLEADVEKVLKRDLKRGTVSAVIRVERGQAAGGSTLVVSQLKQYADALRVVFPNDSDYHAALPGVLALPGVVTTLETSAVPEGEWPAVEVVLTAAVRSLNTARAAEGKAMANELLSLKDTIEVALTRIQDHLPGVTANYQQRMLDRVRQALGESGVTIDAPNLVREVAIFADRIDVAEELTRLGCHLAGFEQIIHTGGDAPGRRLEFVVQEMGREANTLGSKAGDVIISRHVVEIKAALEKIRELVQNVE